MAETKRRARGEDSIYYDRSRDRWTGTITVGWKPDGRRDRITVRGKTKTEVKDRLKQSALGLSGGQQQRLCIARAIAIEPDVVLLDEPASALDPIATASIEDLIHDLRRDLAVVIVTHNLAQAQRVADKVAFMYLGNLVEYGETEEVFEQPRATRTREYVQGAFG